MGKLQSREALLQAGLRMMATGGYKGTSVRDVAGSAGVSLGSFTHHFKSKEMFSVEVLDRYFDALKTIVEGVFADNKISPRLRLQKYFTVISEGLSEFGWTRGCLIGDLSIEATFGSEILRKRLAASYREWLEPIAICISAGQKSGEIASQIDPAELADFVLTSWQGAILRMKVEGGSGPLDRFREIIFSTILI